MVRCNPLSLSAYASLTLGLLLAFTWSPPLAEAQRRLQVFSPASDPTELGGPTPALFARTQEVLWYPTEGARVHILAEVFRPFRRNFVVAIAPDTGRYVWDTTRGFRELTSTACRLRINTQSRYQGVSDVFVVENDEQLWVNDQQGETQPGSGGAYHSELEIERKLRDLDAANSISRIQIGTSLRGRSIFVAKITSPGDLRQGRSGEKKLSVVFVAGLHAREWIGPETALRLVEELATATDPGTTWLRQNAKIYVLVVANPDGLAWSQRFWDKSVLYPTWRSIVPGTDAERTLSSIRDGRYRRKNLRDQVRNKVNLFSATDQRGDEPTLTGDSLWGVDLNRNFLTNFFEFRCKTSMVYPGPSPGSEPETLAIEQFLTDFPAGDLVGAMDIHNNAQELLYQVQVPAVGENYPNTVDRLQAVIASRLNQGPYSFTPVADAATLKGTLDTHAAWSFRIPGLTLELPRNTVLDGRSFFVPDSLVPGIFDVMRRAPRTLVDWSTGPAWVVELQIHSCGGYHAEWVDTSDTTRQLRLDESQPLDVGDHEVRIRFNRPMNLVDSSTTPPDPTVTYGAVVPYNQFAVEKTVGWTQTVYPNDTWVGKLTVPGPPNAGGCNGGPPAGIGGRFTMSIDMTDPYGNRLDGKPSTIIRWDGQWTRYEDEYGNDTGRGGKDWNHTFLVGNGQ